jgi:predicted XRE-type DNA-binding protein
MSERTKHTKSSGNVFKDLGVKDSELHHIRTELAIMLIDLIGRLELTQTKAAAILGITQPELSRLKSGDLSHYGVERLLGFLNRLDQRVEIRVKPSRRRKAGETVLSK